MKLTTLKPRIATPGPDPRLGNADRQNARDRGYTGEWQMRLQSLSEPTGIALGCAAIDRIAPSSAVRAGLVPSATFVPYAPPATPTATATVVNLRRALALVVVALPNGMPSKPPTFRQPASPVGTHHVAVPRETYYGTQEWKALRRQALRRDGYQCTMLACTTPQHGTGGRLIVDHIIERRKVGPDAMGNLRTLCTTCDADRHGTRGGG